MQPGPLTEQRIEPMPKESHPAVEWPLPQPEAERQVGNSQSWKARGNLNPRDGILRQTMSRPSVANQVFLGSWMVDIVQEGCGLISAHRGDTQHT